ncbi:hypothetical protein MUK42_36403 [Musa troglodytarum]|uniref:Uncharacterized protein n=1 Tax=Musa troglodytarum TaxID=320322 RepID=A0A9E7EEP8_9LILI|nr:hypothetical protein MUK42_36403 [Musa troglodytarum]
MIWGRPWPTLRERARSRRSSRNPPRSPHSPGRSNPASVRPHCRRFRAPRPPAAARETCGRRQRSRRQCQESEGGWRGQRWKGRRRGAHHKRRDSRRGQGLVCRLRRTRGWRDRRPVS